MRWDLKRVVAYLAVAGRGFPHKVWRHAVTFTLSSLLFHVFHILYGWEIGRPKWEKRKCILCSKVVVKREENKPHLTLF